MLMRREPERRVAVPQPSHAWVTGQLAAAWGDGDFETPAPRDDVLLAAALHDIGWAAWERAPTRDPATGWPRGTASPWPFGADPLRLTANGKVLAAPFPSDDALRRGLGARRPP